MELPPDAQKFKRDLYMMIGGGAVALTDLGISFTENPKAAAARAIILTTGAAGALIGSLGSHSMSRSSYELPHNTQSETAQEQN